jgi:hypothetical protein
MGEEVITLDYMILYFLGLFCSSDLIIKRVQPVRRLI